MKLIKLFFFSIFILHLFPAYQQIKIGKIDSRYQNKLTSSKLKELLKEVEKNLETTMGFNLFDFGKNGKPINILYIAPSGLEKKYEEKLKEINSMEKKTEQLKKDIIEIKKQLSLEEKKTEIAEKKYTKEINDKITEQDKKINSIKKAIDKKVIDLNNYVKKMNRKNQRGELDKTEYDNIRKYQKKQLAEIQLQENQIKKEIKKYNALQRDYANKIKSFYNFKENNQFEKLYDRKVILYNSHIKDYNRLGFELEAINRRLRVPKKKGEAFGMKKIDVVTSYKNGKKTKTIKVETIMKKIDIYGFENFNELKVVLAHELLHLVGASHVNIKGALMNPLLQKEQLDKLQLTKQDIINVKRNFKK